MKKTLTLIGLLTALNLNLLASDVLISAQLKNSFDLDQVDSIFVAFGIPQGLVAVTNGVDIYTLLYETVNPRGDTLMASGALVVPNGDTSCPYPLASYQHGTTATRNGVPSEGSAELFLGMLLAADEYIVALPDYMGLGQGEGFHPYQHGEATASAVIDMLRASKEQVNTLPTKYSDQLFLWGYSQGGHATMYTQKVIEARHSDEFTITAAAPMSGAYDLSGVQTEALLSDDPYSNPAYLPYLLLGFKEVEPILDTIDIEDVLVPPYDTLIPPMFDGLTGMGTINAAMPQVPKHVFDTTVLNAFIRDSLTHPLRIALKNSDAFDFNPVAPIKMYYCEADEQVFYQNSLSALDYFTSNGATNVEALSMGATLDHGGCISPAMLNGKNWFDGLKTPFDHFEFELLVTHESAPGAADGVAAVQVSGGTGGSYTVDWSTGASGNDTIVDALATGTYSVTVTGESGCSKTSTFTIGTGTSVQDQLERSIRVYPIPADNFLLIDLGAVQASGTVILHDLSGKMLKTAGFDQFDQQIKLNTAEVAAGSYVITITSSSASVRRVLIVE